MLKPNQVEKIMRTVLGLTAIIPVAIMLYIFGYLVVNGISAINPEFLLGFPRMGGIEGGIFPAIVGTINVVVICLIVAIPLGVGAAIYLAEYAPNNQLTKTIRFFVECLAGIPSIIIGLFGYIFLVHYLKLGFSILAGGLALAFMVLPWTIRASEEAIKAIPQHYREASFALGAGKWQTIKNVVLKTAFPGICTGILLAFGKAIGETAVVLFTAGMGSVASLPTSIFDSARTLPVHLYIVATTAHTTTAFEKAYGTAVVLLGLFLILTLGAIFLRNYYGKMLRG